MLLLLQVLSRMRIFPSVIGSYSMSRQRRNVDAHFKDMFNRLNLGFDGIARLVVNA